MGEASRKFALVAFWALPFMIGLFGAAIANIRKPETHKRLMYTLMASMMTPAVARVFLAFLAPAGTSLSGPPPVFVAIPPAIVGFAMMAVAMIYDRRTHGRVHKAYVYGLAVLLLNNILLLPLSGTHVWMATAEFLEHLPG